VDSQRVRQTFIDFFRAKGHTVVPGGTVVPQNDPSLLFTNAGMNQFKDVFMGTGTRSYTRAVNSQLCVRVSGKHNDLEEVGRDTTHQTLFEMLGNWSFGDYYKKEAITWAWELLTSVYGLPKEKLYASVFDDDQEALDLWLSETDIKPDHVLKFDAKENFWEMADTGPCGPCSEIHIDLGNTRCREQDVPGHHCEVNGDCGRYVELWNLVFIQYDRQKDGSLADLPQKHIDTGAGFERLASVLQGVSSNYDIDIMTPIIEKIVALTKVPYQKDEAGMPHRVIADHIRTLVFAIADNVIPSNEGRGYVLRRLLRRALRYGQKLNVHSPILNQLVDTVIDTMGDFFEHLLPRREHIKACILAEEEAFLRTLDVGMDLFETLAKKIKAKNDTIIPGSEAFKLYDTYGFPIDLTELLARESGLTVDRPAFEKALQAQRSQSQTARKGDSGEAELPPPSRLIKESQTSIQTTHLHPSEYTDNIPRGGEARILTDQGEKIQMARHHTATHLLQAALQNILGNHVFQAGSLVDVDRLRFDYAHPKALTNTEIQAIEDFVTENINSTRPVEVMKTTLDKAKAMGAMALFGEKYDQDNVRVIAINKVSTELCGGTHVQKTGDIEAFKIIHETGIATGTRRIEALAGKANIDAYLSDQKTKHITQLSTKQQQLKTLAQEIQGHSGTFDAPEANTTLDALSLEDLAELEHTLTRQLKKADKTLHHLKSQEASNIMDTLKKEIHPIPKTDRFLIATCFDGYDMSLLKEISDRLVSQESRLIVVLASAVEDKGIFLVKLDKGLGEAFDARNLIRELTKQAGGGGGGRPDMAQAGGADPTKLREAVDSLAGKLGKDSFNAS